MFKSIIVHIGAGKTGSSAIQTFLRLNADRLQSYGYLVGDRSLDGNRDSRGNQVWFFENLRKDVGKGREALDAKVSQLSKANPDCHTLILSAENLSNSNGHEGLFQDLANESELTIVFYIRRQDEFLQSAWQQWYAKETADFDGWWKRSKHLADWRRVCQKWEAIVGRRAMQIRVYDPAWFVGGSLFTDFLASCGCTEDGNQFAVPRGAVNASFSDAVTELIKGKLRLFESIHDNEFYDTIKSLTGDKFKKRSGETFLPLSTRMEIVESYADGNQWIRERYFPHVKDGQSLFPSPASESTRELSSAEIENEKVEIILSMIRELHRRVVVLQAAVGSAAPGTNEAKE